MFCKIVIIFRADLVQAVYRQGGGLAVPGSDHGRHHSLHHRLGSVILQASLLYWCTVESRGDLGWKEGDLG